MDLQTLLNICGGIATLIVGGYVRFVQAQLDKARDLIALNVTSLTEFRIEVAHDYVRHDDLRRMEDALIRIEAKLDGKMDK